MKMTPDLFSIQAYLILPSTILSFLNLFFTNNENNAICGLIE